MAEKQNHKERLKEITDSIETGIMELFESDKYKSYLQTMSRFHKYSLNNTLLISMQKPDATLVAGFNKWRDGFSCLCASFSACSVPCCYPFWHFSCLYWHLP